jgi:squalene-hopene/tetraprenyl-beta-curcumene cyclase
MTVVETRPTGAAEAALERAREHLLSLQHADGYWKGELETNVTIESEDLFLRHYLGLLDARQTAATARWIRSRQREDGSFATFYGGPADLSTTAESYVALRLAGDEPAAEHMRRAAQVV